MQVKIIKSKLPTYWYADMIGELFEVENDSELEYMVIQDPDYPIDRDGNLYIEIEDTELIDSD
jgi:hypothetical protein